MTTPRLAQTAALALLLLTVLRGSASAAAGALDPTFGSDGRRVFPFAGIPTDALVQPDGKIVLAGYDANYDFAVWRLGADGSLDCGFDGDGTATLTFGSQDAINAVAVQRDGKIVVAGSTYDQGTDMAVARLNVDGSVDKTFDPGGPDGDGKKIIHTEHDMLATAVAVQPGDGAILLAASGAGVGSFGLTRLTSTGVVDGTVFEDPPGMRYEYASDAVLQPDGSIVVAGTAFPDTEEAWVPRVARYTPQGALDKTFAGTGVASLPGLEPAEVLLRADGSIVIAGSAGEPDSRMAVAQLTRAGEVDDAFGDGGRATADFDGKDTAAAAVLQRDGKLVFAGSAENAFAIARFSTGGILDAGFGSAGKTTVAFGEDSISSATAVQPDGRIVVAGATATNNIARLAVARLLPEDAAGGPLPTGPSGREPAARLCAGRRATLVGTARRDTLRGTRRADVIVALGGDDRVLARGGNDIVCGGAGDDRLSGGAGRDRLRGEQGRDMLRGGAGRDRCLGAAGRDRAGGCESRRSAGAIRRNGT